ncbi:MAG: hypothetical protein ABIY55_17760, partial [Kofleriaceae bacterium]
MAHRVPEGIDLIDAIGTSPRHRVLLPDGVLDFTCVGDMLWVLAPGTGAIDRYLLHGLRPLLPAIRVGLDAQRIAPASGDRAATALITGARTVVAYGLDDQVSTTVIEAAGAVFPLTGRHALAIASDLRVIDASRGEVVRMPVLEKASVLAASSLFSGRAIAVLTHNAQGAQFVVLHPTRGLLHQIAIPQPRCWAIAENRGVALLVVDDDVLAVDLRYGRIHERHAAPAAIQELALDADCQFVAFVGVHDELDQSPLVHTPYTDFMATARRMAPAPATEQPSSDEREPRDEDSRDGVGDHGERAAPAGRAAGPSDAADAPPVMDEPAAPVAPVVVPELVPYALGRELAPLQVAVPPDTSPYDSAREHVDDLIHVVELRAARAIAEAWNTGQLSRPSEDQRPFECEVLAILGRTGGYAPDLLADAQDRLAQHSQRTVARAAATIATGMSLPCVDLAREMGLSPTATQILLVVVAPLIRGEIARLYGVLANDEHRPLVDRFLVEVLVAASDPRIRAEVASELAPDAPLIRYGLVRHDGGSPLFAELSADPVLVDRIRGRKAGSTGVSVLRAVTRSFAELHLPAELKRALVLALAEPRSPDAPLRLVLRGRRGAGRHSVIAALAVRVGSQ